MGPLWGGGAHTEAIDGMEVPLFPEEEEEEEHSGDLQASLWPLH